MMPQEQPPNKLLSFVGYVIVVTLVFAFVFAAGYYITYGIMSVSPQENSTRVKRTVEAVCDYSRDRVSGELEEVCGIAQDTSNTVYRCPKGEPGTNGAPTSECWVEDDL